ncbi:MAG: glycosyltransferase family 39 protein [Thermodesulfovibrionales bacterium]
MHHSAWDAALFRLINGTLHFRLMDPAMVFVTSRPYLVILPLVFAIFVRDRRRALTAFALATAALLLADWAAYVLKDIVARPRPCTSGVVPNLLVGCTASHSMPSSHASNVFAFVLPFLYLTKDRLKYLLLAAAVAVAYSRPYVGVHYPSDVLVGAAIGLSAACLAIFAYRLVIVRAEERPYPTFLGVVLLVVSLFRIYYITRGYLDISPDEAHYWEWSRHLDLSFYSKGPLIAYLIAAGTAVFGDNELGVRALAVVLSALSSVLLYLLGRDLFDEKVGAASAVLFQAVPLFNTYGVVMTIDAPFVFFWIASLLLFHRAVSRDSLAYWSLLGVSMGLGLLAKYTMAFFYPCAALFLLAARRHRRLLLSLKPYWAAALSLVFFSPVIIWNARNGWVSLKHTAYSHLNVDEGLKVSLGSVLNFVGGQLAVVTPILMVLVLYALIKRERTERWSFLFWFSVPMLLFFLAKSIQGKVQANWAMAGYLTGLLAFSSRYLRDFGRAGKARKALVATAVSMSLILSAVAHFTAELHFPRGMDPSQKLRGWKPLGAEVSAIKADLGGLQFIFSDSYQVASELAFYVEGHPRTYCVNLGRRMNQYDLWPGPWGLLNYSAIFVTMNDSPLDERVRRAFESCQKRLFDAHDRKGRDIREYSIFLCRGFKGMQESKPEAF